MDLCLVLLEHRRGGVPLARRLATFHLVKLYTSMGFDEGLIGPSLIQDTSMLLSLCMAQDQPKNALPLTVTQERWGGTAAAGSHEGFGLTSLWDIGRFFHAVFYFFAGIAKLHILFLGRGGVFETPIASLFPDATLAYLLHDGAWIIKSCNMGAAISEAAFGVLLLMPGSLAILGGVLASGMHATIFLGQFVAFVTNHKNNNPKLFGWQITCLVYLFVLFLHPTSRRELRQGAGGRTLFTCLFPVSKALADLGHVTYRRRCMLAALVLCLWVAMPLAFVTLGLGHPKWMLGMYDSLTPEDTGMYLLDEARAPLAPDTILAPMLKPDTLSRRRGKLNLKALTSKSHIDRGGEGSCAGRVPSLIEGLGEGHHTSALMWAHHIAHLSQSPVTVFWASKIDPFTSRQQYYQSIVEFKTEGGDPTTRVTLRRPPSKVLTVAQRVPSDDPYAGPDWPALHTVPRPLQYPEGFYCSEGEGGQLEDVGFPKTCKDVQVEQCRLDVELVLLCRRSCCETLKIAEGETAAEVRAGGTRPVQVGKTGG